MEKSLVINGLIKDIRAKKVEARKLHNSKDPRLSSMIEEINHLEGSLYQLLDCYSDNNHEKDSGFVDVLKVYAGVKKASESDQVIINYMREAAGEDGGFLVPTDIQTQIKALRKNETSLETFVNVETVYTSKGKRTYEIRATSTPFNEVLEDGEIPEVPEDKLKEVSYEIKKYAGIIKVTNELFSDNNKVVLIWLKKWLARKSNATRNKAIVDKINEITLGKEVQIATDEELKAIFNKTLDAAYTDNAAVVTNKDGYNFIDNLYDIEGNKVLRVENRKPLLYGLYPVIKLSDDILPNNEAKAPIICGDLEAAITLFDREKLTVDISSNGDTFFSDMTKIKERDRFEVKAVDNDAIAKAYATIV